ncbi:MAG: aldo/keto reductase [bacterium]|nr:aldo/keto reductase [bacterium]
MVTRREMVRVLGAVPAAGLLSGGPVYAQARRQFHHRQLGRTGRWVVPLGLGGQGALQWTPQGVEPHEFVMRAVQLGINYLDTANSYGPSQAHLGAAFRKLRLVPGERSHNDALRERLFLATNTEARDASGAVADLKRSLTTIFGDGDGEIPDGAYVDSMQLRNIETIEDVNKIYAPDGALAALVDFRDGTNATGLNPKGRHWLRHIGITGHKSSRVLMNAIQRDTGNVLDTLLVALNANDRRSCAHQHNVLPLAVARGMGVIAMKVFADGVFYGKPARPSAAAEDVITSVGKEGAADPKDLVRYSVSLPGVACAITGIGHIDWAKPERDQLAVNLTAALGDLASEVNRRAIEREVQSFHGDRTNYFQDPPTGMTQPTGIRVARDDDRLRISWEGALAGEEPIRSYIIVAGGKMLAWMPYRPQTTLKSHSVIVPAADAGDAPIAVIASIRPPR